MGRPPCCRLFAPLVTLALVLGVRALPASPSAASFPMPLAPPGAADLLADPQAWQPQMGWLANASPKAAVTRTGTGLRFAVPMARRGMKWLRPVENVWLSETPYLTLRYRAQGIAPGPDYLVWLQAGKGIEAIRLDQVQPDAQWHTLTVPVGAGEVGGIAVQVQAASADAWLEIAALEFTEQGAAPLPAAPVAEWRLDDHRTGAWEAKPDWVGNPSDRPSARRAGGVDTFSVPQGRRGMKWALALDKPLDLAPYRYLTLRMRGTGTSGQGDYAVCLLGDARPDGQDYAVVGAAPLTDTAGRWRRYNLFLAPAHVLKRVTGLAVQVQAADGPARLEIASLRLVASPVPEPPGEGLRLKPGWRAGSERSFRPLHIGSACNLDLAQAQRAFRLDRWFSVPRLTAEGIPFQVAPDGPRLAATGYRDESTVAIPVSGRASEVYLLVTARLYGQEDPGSGGGPRLRLDTVDLLLVTLHYAAGPDIAALPLQVPSGRFGVVPGWQVLAVPADPQRTLQAVSLYVGTARAAVGIAGVTLRTGSARYASHWQVPTVPTARPLPRPAPGKPSGRLSPGMLTLANGAIVAGFDLKHAAALVSLRYRAVRGECVRRPGVPLFRVAVAGKDLPIDGWRLAATAPTQHGQPGYTLTYRRGRATATITLSLVGDSLRFGMVVSGLDGKVELAAPCLPPLALGKPQDMWYLVPSSATLLGCRPRQYGGWYSGAEVGLQFLDAFDPALGAGVSLQVRDLDNREKAYRLVKDQRGVAMEVTYQQRTLRPTDHFQAAPTEILLHDGDWHQAFHAYLAWARTWYRPAAPRPQWWREVFNFRQRFLYWNDPLVDATTGEYRMAAALDEAEREFGGCEYLHIFDWGNCGPYGRIYGRTGDYDPGDYLPGGWEGFRQAVETARRRGMRVGYYIEGYLLDERGKIGVAHGAQWQMRGEGGEGLRWPGSPEIYVCPAIPEWQHIQADTYRRMVARMDADGMYLDEFGFTGPSKWCWATDHPHPRPGSSLQAEQALTRRVRVAMSQAKPEAVLYTEDTPTDVNSQYQEGSFCYSINRHRSMGSLVPLKLFRFAFPDFKSIEILDCDQPTGADATGVRRIFWNGEAIWLEGNPTRWFAPQTLRAIRDCHRVLHEHKAAFAGDDVEPLVPTLAPGVWANRFSGEGETVYTLYNSANVTYTGPVLALPHRPGARYRDAFSGREIIPQVEHGQARVSLTIAPQGVGCIAVSRCTRGARHSGK